MEPHPPPNLSAYHRLGPHMNDNHPFDSHPFPVGVDRLAWPGILALNAFLICGSGCVLVALTSWYR